MGCSQVLCGITHIANDIQASLEDTAEKVTHFWKESAPKESAQSPPDLF